MLSWPKHPKIYEISTWVWLSDLSRKYGVPIDLGSVPAAEWDAVAGFGFDAVWLMGVWQRSPAGIAIANRNRELSDDFRRTLPDFETADNVGSPYCIRSYQVDQHLGGSAGLKTARRELTARRIRLVLDFVPNHVAPDHPWAIDHPEFFIQGSAEDLERDPSSFISTAGHIYACGRDPNFPAWPDVLQLNAFHPALRAAAVETLSHITSLCDGVRCDMAILALNHVFERTWHGRFAAEPETEYWRDVISAVKNRKPGVLFLAEAYWDLEGQLLSQGFDLCYDKKLYDRLRFNTAEDVLYHLGSDCFYQQQLLRFLENHDEHRAAEVFSPARERAAAVVVATVPGARLFHEGQFEGRKIRPSIFLGRRPPEPPDRALQDFYKRLLQKTSMPVFHEGQWSLCGRRGWPDNSSFHNLLAWNWTLDEERYLVVVNFSDSPAQALIHIPWDCLPQKTWQLTDLFSDTSYDRPGDELQEPGLYVGLDPWSWHFFECTVQEAPRTIRRRAA